jgi:hypothetical protein
MPGERKTARKKDAGPRALALLQLAANGNASLVPIAILANGKFWDATAYKAAPFPMALEPGTVYEAERSGNSLGLFTVGSALHSRAANAASPWIGTGAWLPAGTEAPNKPLKAESVPVGIDTSNEPPRLTRNPQKEAPPASSTPASAPASGPGSGDEPPRLTKPTPPSESKPTEAKTAERANVPESDSGASEADRPRLRRGKPAELLPEEEIPGYGKPGAAPSADAGKNVETKTTAGPVELIPAISDADGPEPHSFSFAWLKNEEAERRQQMMDLARQQLRAYLDAQAKARITGQGPGAQAQRRGPGRNAAEPVFENARLVAYDLWTNNQPVLILSAEAHVPPAAGSAENPQYFILAVAYPDIYNNLHKIYAGVTDNHHLDIAPRLELIDAVDADGDGRGELLFRETSDAGSGWVIYRATADRLWKMFDSLNPE